MRLKKPRHLRRTSTPARTPTSDATQLLRALALQDRAQNATIAEAVQHKVQLAMRLLGVRTVFVSALTDHEMRVLLAEDNDGCAIPSGAVLPLEDSFCQYVKATDAPVVIPDAANDVRVQHVAARTSFQIGSYIGVPIHLSGGRPYGTLCALDPESCDFTPAHVSLMQILAHEIGELIERELLVQRVMADANTTYTELLATFTVIEQQQSVLGIVAHDLRTPLNALYLGNDALLSGDFGALTPAQTEIIEAMTRSTRYMQRLITDLLDASRTSAQFSVLNEAYDAVAVAQQAVAMCAGRAAAAGLALHCQADAAQIPMVGDAARVTQILLNLIGNAITYTANGEVRVQVSTDAETALFTICDTGVGIAQTDQQRIWQLRERATEEQQGYGLGLYVVALLAQQMGGEVGVQSTLGVGSTFWVRLPRTALRPQRAAWSFEPSAATV